MKIGFYGGAFDPIHNAHLIIAQFIKEALDLDKVVFIPSAYPPHKEIFLEPDLRFQMVEDAIRGNPAFECSDIEIKNNADSYTVDTLKLLHKRMHLKKENAFWIMGSDSFLDLPKWKAPEEIMSLCTVVVFPRRDDDFQKASERLRKQAYYIKDSPLIEISSTLIRSFVKQRRSIRYLVPTAVKAAILENGYYI